MILKHLFEPANSLSMHWPRIIKRKSVKLGLKEIAWFNLDDSVIFLVLPNTLKRIRYFTHFTPRSDEETKDQLILVSSFILL